MSVDLFTWDQKKFALLIDWYSNYCFLKRFRSEPDTQDVVDFLEDIFHEHRYCLKLRSDGAPNSGNNLENTQRGMGLNGPQAVATTHS